MIHLKRRCRKFAAASYLLEQIAPVSLNAFDAVLGLTRQESSLSAVLDRAAAAIILQEEREKLHGDPNGRTRSKPGGATGGPVEAARFANPEIYWESVFEAADPWNYTSAYEELKYARTLSILPGTRIGRALELACAEGHFTALLSPRVDALTAVDISTKALDRARERCRRMQNVEFQKLDFFSEPLAGAWNLIICSEVLYFLNDLAALRNIAEKIRSALTDGGYFLTAHARLLADEPCRTGFEWDHEFGAATIAKVFGETEGLAHLKSLETDLYRIDLFQKAPAGSPPAEIHTPIELRLPVVAMPEARVQRAIVWGGAISPACLRARCTMTRAACDVPVLMYHQVDRGPSARFRVLPERLEQQLRFLRRRGFRSLSLEEWCSVTRRRGRFHGRPVMLTFDDATEDFFHEAWPIIERNGFSAVVFVATGKVGVLADWRGNSNPSRVMDWDRIVALSREGVEFGSHLCSHTAASWLRSEDLLREGARSRATLEHVLGRAVNTVALPYGITGQRVRGLLRACGYTAAFGAQYGLASSFGSPLDIPRIEISGEDDLNGFASKLQLSHEPPDLVDTADTGSSGSRNR